MRNPAPAKMLGGKIHNAAAEPTSPAPTWRPHNKLASTGAANDAMSTVPALASPGNSTSNASPSADQTKAMMPAVAKVAHMTPKTVVMDLVRKRVGHRPR